MASVTIVQGRKNLMLGAEVANDTGAVFEEDGQWITISDGPILTIPRSSFNKAFDPDGRRNHAQLEQSWRSLLLNKRGHLIAFNDSEIVISDEKPSTERPQFLLRFPVPAAKTSAEEWAKRAGFDSLTSFVLAAVENFCQVWRNQATQSPPVDWRKEIGDLTGKQARIALLAIADGQSMAEAINIAVTY